MPSNAQWDPVKAELNRRRHGVSFGEAETVFYDPLVAWEEDRMHPDEEDRFIAIGTSSAGSLLVVIYCIRDDEYPLISAGHATPSERRAYMRGDTIRDEAMRAIDLEEIPEITDFSGFKRTGPLLQPRGILRVSLDEDVARHYHDSDLVNAALRMLIAEGRAPAPRNE